MFREPPPHGPGRHCAVLPVDVGVARRPPFAAQCQAPGRPCVGGGLLPRHPQVGEPDRVAQRAPGGRLRHGDCQVVAHGRTVARGGGSSDGSLRRRRAGRQRQLPPHVTWLWRRTRRRRARRRGRRACRLLARLRGWRTTPAAVGGLRRTRLRGGWRTTPATPGRRRRRVASRARDIPVGPVVRVTVRPIRCATRRRAATRKPSRPCRNATGTRCCRSTASRARPNRRSARCSRRSPARRATPPRGRVRTDRW